MRIISKFQPIFWNALEKPQIFLQRWLLETRCLKCGIQSNLLIRKREGLASFLLLSNRYFEEQVAGDISDISWYAKFKKLSYEHLYVKHFGRPWDREDINKVLTYFAETFCMKKLLSRWALHYLLRVNLRPRAENSGIHGCYNAWNKNPSSHSLVKATKASKNVSWKDFGLYIHWLGWERINAINQRRTALRNI